MKVVLALLVACVCRQVAPLSVHRVTANTRGAFTASCPSNSALISVTSNYDRYTKYRHWDLQCASDYDTSGSATYSTYVNEKRAMINYKCPTNKAISGISATASDLYGRRYKYQCVSLPGLRFENCGFSSSYLNQWRSTLTYSNSDINKVIVGFYGIHQRYQRDRRWKAYVCSLCSEAITNAWSAWSACSKSCTRPGDAPGSQSRTWECKNQRKQSFCSGIRCSSNTGNKQTQACNENAPCPIPIAGRWSCWSEWSKCSNACGVGTRTRTRSCSNPARANGGAACTGKNRETMSCSTISFVPFKSNTIRGTKDYSLNDVHVYDCMKKCSEDASCKSFVYKPAATKGSCSLSNVNKDTSSSTYREDPNSNYYHKKCKADKPIKKIVRSINAFSDGCHTKRCYDKCGESPYMNKILEGDVDITLRYMHFDLSRLPALLGSVKPRKVAIHAQTVVLNQPLDISYYLVIVARQFSQGPNGKFRYDKPPYSNNLVLTQCATTKLYYDCNIDTPMTLISYYGTGRIDIYAQGIRGGPNCPTRALATELPKFDVPALQLALSCADDLATSSISGATPVAFNIVRYVEHASKDLTGFASPSTATAIGSVAYGLDDEMTAREAGKRSVPLLSERSYRSMLSQYASIFHVLHARYNRIFTKNLGFKNRITDIKLTVDKAKENLLLNKKKVGYAENSVKESEITLKKLRIEFNKSIKSLDKAKKDFDAGIKAYKRKQIVDVVFGFVEMIGQVVSSVGSIMSAKQTLKSNKQKNENDKGWKDDMAGGILGIVSTSLDLTQALADIYDLTKTFEGITTLSTAIAAGVKNGTASVDPEKMEALLKRTATAKVKLHAWDTLKNLADTQLGSGEVPKISGSQDYNKAVNDMCNWAKGLYSETFRHSTLIGKRQTEIADEKMAKDNIALMEKQIKAAEASKLISERLLNGVMMQTINSQLSASLMVSDFCKNYYYVNLAECPDNLRLHVTDSLMSTNEKLNRAAIQSIEAVGTTRSSSPFNAHHVLLDKVTKDCKHAKDCPITTLKQSKQMLLDITLASPSLGSYSRVRLEELRIYLVGAKFKTPTQRIEVSFDSLGEMRDRMNGKTYNFVSMGRQFTFTFDYETKETFDFGCVHRSLGSKLFQLTPFGQWAMQIVDTDNNVDLSGLTRVEIYILGKAIRSSALGHDISGNVWERYGEADRSPQCAGSGNRSK